MLYPAFEAGEEPVARFGSRVGANRSSQDPSRKDTDRKKQPETTMELSDKMKRCEEILNIISEDPACHKLTAVQKIFETNVGIIGEIEKKQASGGDKEHVIATAGLIQSLNDNLNEIIRLYQSLSEE